MRFCTCQESAYNFRVVITYDPPWTLIILPLTKASDNVLRPRDNILENVCKYVQAPGTVSIVSETDHRSVSFTFNDSGPGVPQESLPRLFDRLYRVDSSRGRGGGGSGLGLSICKNIVAHHGGSIWAENNADGGLTIGISLPLEKKKEK